MTSRPLTKRASADGRHLVTWHEGNRLFAWEKGDEHTHGEARASGWARVDTRKPDNAPDHLEDPGGYVGAWNDHQVAERRRSRAIIFSLFPEVYARSMPSLGCVVCFCDPETSIALYEDEIRRKRAGAKPPPEAMSGAGAGPGGLAAVG